ncbi:MAP kinase kinase kinase mkh1 [Psilocybe cubensis]|uniref:Protein kinase domain-containing protein n=2 Tax=Psilocybe cubensis TaxID=181762 RepID=A0A8H7YAP2_PSICU|nr:MAP kinase kinase kinase mkh1 [Psilocybe cubensis]KAH9487024.1 MAP kinase kinase kinase mkh1 [Psilocybe cubensis]
MSEDSRSNKQTARKIYYVANPGSGDSDDAKDDTRPRTHTNGYSNKRPQVSTVSNYHRPTPSQPTLLATDPSVTNSRYPLPQPPLSPDSTDSPSPPPPSTPSQHAHSYSADLHLKVDPPSKALPQSESYPSYQDYRALNDVQPHVSSFISPSRTSSASTPSASKGSKLLKHLKAPFGGRPRPPAGEQSRRPYTSPTVTTPESFTSSSSMASSSVSERVIFVTSDSERYVTVDISSARSASQIRELILNKLGIFNEDELYPYSIYRTEIGESQSGEALTNDRLMAMCRDHGDSKGTLKFFVTQSTAPPQGPSPIQLPDYSSPPVLPPLANTTPLQIKRRSRSRNGSFSSASENIPLEIGYEADLDYPEHDVSRPLARTTHSQPSASSSQTALPSPHRRPSLANQARPSSPLLHSSGAKPQKNEEKYGHALPPLPTPPPPLSPVRPSFLSNEESSSLGIPQRHHHARSTSDAGSHQDSAVKATEHHPETAGQLYSRGLGKLKPEPPRESTRERLTKHAHDDEDQPWDIILPPPQRDEQERVSPSLTRGSRQPSYSSQYRPSSPYTPRHPVYNSSRPSQPSVPLPLQTQRPSSQPRPPANVPIPGSVFVNWKGEEGGSSRKPTPPSSNYSSTRLGKSMTKSMNDLKFAASHASSSQSRRNLPSVSQLPMTRQSNIARVNESPYSPSNLPASNMSLNVSAKSYEPPRSFSRPLPVHGTADFHHSSSSSYLSRGGGYSSNLSTTNNDPYPRPQSASGDPVTSPTRGYTRLQSPVYGSTLESGESNQSPRTISPNRPYHSPGIPGPRPRPTTSSDRSGSSDIQSGPETSNTTPPRTPISPHSPRYDPSERNGLVEEQSPPSSPDDIVIKSTESTLKQKDQMNLLDMLHGSYSQPTRQISPPPPPLESKSSYAPDDGDDDDDFDNEGGTWIVRPEAPKSAARPPLTVQIESSSSSSSSSRPTENGTHHSNRPDGSAKDTHPPSSYRPLPYTSVNPVSRRPESTFVDPEGDNWAPRPPPENIYEHLEKFFPTHDLDKPVIEATSGDTSPTNAEPAAALPPPVQIDERAKIRAKKSIRIVAQEHKKRIDRTSRATDTSRVDNMMRKRSTKLWGSKLEEVTTAQGRSVNTNSIPESPSGGPTTFKWVRGELIGKGTYGRVYLALNATTGEMIAVKQVELPQTPSDKNDSRHHTVVQALKMESETLRDLDHPNIVQYLGFEETPANLSIFLEYVPGGSVGSCLHKHGKFDDNVTRSFTAQILSGLEYLHSKGILHRDMKADNILVEMSGICKISDFGISKRTEDLQGGAFTAMKGTVFWMAPEVINTNKKGYNFKVDIWSVGCVVLEMWAGSRPWMGEEMIAVMFKLYQSKQPPPVPEDVVLSEEADDFRRKCFAINPEERPTAAELRKHPYLILPPGWVFTGFT